MDDDDIRIIVTRLARPHPSGGTVIEHGGAPEAAKVDSSTRKGLHGMRTDAVGAAEARAPSRFVLPAGALD